MQKTKGMLVALTIAATLLTGAQGANAAAAFTDTKTHWAKSQIDSAVSRGWINGYDTNTFKPNANMTRAEFLKSLVASLKLKVEDTDTPFADDKGWFRAYIAVGLKQSMIKVGDYKENNFEPNKMITREEIARMTIRALGKESEGVKSGYLAVAKKLEIMKGYPDGTMGGEKNATRAEAVVMVLNTLKVKNPVEVVVYPKTKEELNSLIQSLPSFKGNTTLSRDAVLVNLKGTDVFLDNKVMMIYSAEYKRTTLNTYDSSEDIKALVKDILKVYYPISYEKAYSSYLKVNSSKAGSSTDEIETTYDGRSFVVYRSADNIGVSFWIGG